MKYDFDEVIAREGTSCVKYDLRKEMFGNPDVIPVWVADMDFRTPGFIISAIKKRLDHEILGYSIRSESFYNSFIQWVKVRHGLEVQRDWIVFTPGIVPALNFAVLSQTKPGDKIIVQPPVYFPFFNAITDHGRIQVDNPLVITENRHEMDFDQLERQIDDGVKMIILCSPHNPGGRVWTRKDLVRLGEICLKNNIILLSDEIHSDLILFENKHIPSMSISEELANLTISCFAPSKTFNLAGLSTSVVVIKNEEMRNHFKKTVESLHIGMGNIFGAVATQAAYEKGAEWLQQLLEYVEGNIRYVESFCKEKMPEIKVMIPEATYMIWMDFRGLGMNNKRLKDFLINECRVGLNDGRAFGTGGEGFQRLNVACPRSTIIQVMQNIYEKYRLYK